MAAREILSNGYGNNSIDKNCKGGKNINTQNVNDKISTDFNVQLNSLDNQVTYYKDFIKNNSNWEYVEGYVTKDCQAYQPQSVSILM